MTSPLIALLVCLIPTTIGGLLSAIGIAGMDRWCSTTCWPCPAGRLRRPATWTCCCWTRPAPSRWATAWRREFVPVHGVTERGAGRRGPAGSRLADETPEGRSIVVLAKEKYGLRGRELGRIAAEFIPFTAQTRMSGVNIERAR